MTHLPLALPGARSLHELLEQQPELLVETLSYWLPSQRWFPLKSTESLTTQLVGWCPLDDALRAAIVLLRIESPNLEPAWLQLALGLADAGTQQAVVVEGLEEPAVAQPYAGVVTTSGLREGVRLRLESTWDGARGRLPPRSFQAEQSNSALLLGRSALVKLYRRVRFGPNPEPELLHFLSSANFPHVPRLVGYGRGHTPDGSFDAWTAQAFLPNAVDGWSWWLARIQSAPLAPRRLQAESEALGRLTAKLHIVLASARMPGIEPRPLAAAELLDLAVHESASARALATRLWALGHDAIAVLQAAEQLSRWQPPSDELGLAIRVHGDLHLGQVLRSRGEWYVTDFEGEPARTLEARRALQCPLVDVAGMLRSFDYAAASFASGGQRRVTPEPWRNAFLESYRQTASAEGEFLPLPGAFNRLLTFFELRKALYEVAYEADNRPSWVHVPLNAIAALAEALE